MSLNQELILFDYMKNITCVVHYTLFANSDEKWQNDETREKCEWCVESDSLWFMNILQKKFFAKPVCRSRWSLDEQKVLFFTVVRDIFSFCENCWQWQIVCRCVFFMFCRTRFFLQKVVSSVFANCDKWCVAGLLDIFLLHLYFFFTIFL